MIDREKFFGIFVNMAIGTLKDRMNHHVSDTHDLRTVEIAPNDITTGGCIEGCMGMGILYA